MPVSHSFIVSFSHTRFVIGGVSVRRRVAWMEMKLYLFPFNFYIFSPIQPAGPVSLFSDSTGLHQLDPTTLHARLENNSGGAGTFEQGLPHLGLTAYDTARPFLYP